ncbi:MAG: BREX system ATP-binding domain-containing protein [Pirellulaceae bacterium]
MVNLDRRTATRVIHSLGESGQPPKHGAKLLNVGTEAFIRRLRKDYLEDLLPVYEGQDGSGACKWVEANYGNGKTQFLRCMQDEAWSLNYVTAFVELSQDECPLDHPERIYGAVAKALQASPLDASDVDRGRGIDQALLQLLDRKFPGVFSGISNQELIDQAIAWVETSLAATPVESSGFRTAAVQYLVSVLRAESRKAQAIACYLRNEPFDTKELRQFDLFEKIDKASGFRFLRSLCQLIQRSGLATGTVFLFDEARRSLSLMSRKSQKVACENLLTIINRCNSGDLPGTLFLYAVMPEFFTDFATAYPALQQRCSPSTRINLESLQGIRELDLLQMIGEKITEVFRKAYEDAPTDRALLKKNLACVAEHVLRETMAGNGTRRLLVISWVHALKDFRDSGLRLLSPEDVKAIAEGAQSQLNETDAASVEREGE